MSHPDTPLAPSGDQASTPHTFGGGQPAPGRSGSPETHRRSGLAIAALVVGIVSVLLCLIPVVNIASIVGGVVALVLGVVALRRLAPGVTGKGLAISGILLGVLSVVVAVVVWVVLGQALRDAIDSGELDAVLEDAAAAQENSVVENSVVEDEVVAGDVVVPEEALAVGEAAADPAAVPADVVRDDFSDIDCDLLAEDAVLISQNDDTGAARLVKIRESAVVEDHRTDYVVPAGADESLVLSCRGTAAWSDSTDSSVLTELTIDADGDLFVAYAGE